MKIPTKVRIAGVDYLVTIQEGLNNGEAMLCGHIQFDKPCINLSPDQGHQQMSLTLIHEVLHGIFFHYGIEMKKKKEEEIVERLTYGLYQVLQDNARKLFDIVPEVTTDVANSANIVS